MKVILKYGGGTVELPDAAAVELVRQGNAVRHPSAVVPLAVAAAMSTRAVRVRAGFDAAAVFVALGKRFDRQQLAAATDAPADPPAVELEPVTPAAEPLATVETPAAEPDIAPAAPVEPPQPAATETVTPPAAPDLGALLSAPDAPVAEPVTTGTDAK